MIVILAIDGLEYDYVREFDCKNLMQKEYGKTDISEFEEPRTIVLWSSFLTGKNKEKEVLAKKNMWDFKVDVKETFLSRFENPLAIDVPGYNYMKEHHDRERELLKKFFDKKATVDEYDKLAFQHHNEIKSKFLEALDRDHGIVLGYFSLADVIGHLSFGKKVKMKMIYNEMDKIAKEVSGKCGNMFVISDHGMKAIGVFGDHSDHGFWSTNFNSCLKTPRITDFYDVLIRLV